MDNQDGFTLASHGPSMPATEVRREASFLSRKVLLPNKKRMSAQKSSSSLVLKEDEARLTLQKSSSCVAFQKNDVEISIASWSRDTGADGQVSKPLLVAASSAECRICQDEDELTNLETPCACTGSLKFAHRNCVQHWCNEKGDTICEICKTPYEGGYTAPPSSARSDSFPINIGDSWEIASGQRFDLHEPRIFAVTSEHLFSEAEYEAYSRANEQSAACFRSVALILMVLLLLRHVLSITSTGADEDASTFFMLFLLRTAGFFLPCYIMARALNVLQCRRQRQEAALAAAEVAYLLQSGQAQGVRIAVSPGLLP
ncbi:hypothetical protein GOP47_0024812 [Adiantum capillus-veneris]|uniref:RING-CH-type domain-containing protein n=1 Tax=Adiantum capillus-veneris TaxID=13818 RepID=A0A9D4U2Y9_ADICA|nr:hypothetical protein GOP47_0024812 [Adiantum capillus-veneris]